MPRKEGGEADLLPLLFCAKIEGFNRRLKG